jgi:hypothetical protein
VRGKGPLAFLFGFGYMHMGVVKGKAWYVVKYALFEAKRKEHQATKVADKKASDKRKKMEEKKNKKNKKKKKTKEKGGEEEEEEEGDGASSSDEEEEEEKEEEEEEEETAMLLGETKEEHAMDEDEEDATTEATTDATEISDSSEIFDALHGLLQADAVLDVEYAAEMRMVIHFQLLTIVSAKSRVEKESVEFQMFLRENRFKLMANGVTPPASIFRSNSYANIDMKLVANWLIRLTNEQHERFNQLRERFSDEMEEREHVQDMEDAQLREDEEAYLEMREQEDWRQGQVFLQEVQQRRSKREAEGVVRGIYMIHVGCTRCVTSSTDNIMKRHARITLTVEFIRTCIFKFLLYVSIQGRVGSRLTFFRFD